MNNREKYDFYRDNLAIGIAQMAKKFDDYKINDKDFEDIFNYALLQLKNFDKLWAEILIGK